MLSSIPQGPIRAGVSMVFVPIISLKIIYIIHDFVEKKKGDVPMWRAGIHQNSRKTPCFSAGSSASSDKYSQDGS